MSVIYIDDYGAYLGTQSDQLVLKKESGEKKTFRTAQLDYVVMNENCSLSSSAMSLLLRNGIDLSIVSRGGIYLGRLESVAGKNISLRKVQYSLSEDNEFTLQLAKNIVAGKIRNMRRMIMRYGRSDKHELKKGVLSRLSLLRRNARSCDSYEKLLGLEGSAAREYFSTFSELLKPPFQFTERNRRPPQDPVNSMLGFSYALLENTVERAVNIVGLDPYCGFLHKLQYGRQGLVFDLMEEFRPIIADSVVINLCNRSIVELDTDFEERDGGVFLTKSGREKVFTAYYTRIHRLMNSNNESGKTSYEKIIEMQARTLSNCINSMDSSYKPFETR